jgi:hypothetical protein
VAPLRHGVVRSGRDGSSPTSFNPVRASGGVPAAKSRIITTAPINQGAIPDVVPDQTYDTDKMLSRNVAGRPGNALFKHLQSHSASERRLDEGGPSRYACRLRQNRTLHGMAWLPSSFAT